MSPQRACHRAILAHLANLEATTFEPRSDPVSEARPDLNATLANLSLTFEQNARISRQKAAEAMKGLTSNPEAEPYEDARRYEAIKATEAAEKWEARAATARGGYLLFTAREYSDPLFMSDYADVVQACQEQGRISYEMSVEDQRIQQGDAGGSSA